MGLTLSGKVDGIKVSAIKPGSVADRAGQVKIGDILLAVNGKDVRNKALSEAVVIIEKSFCFFFSYVIVRYSNRKKSKSMGTSEKCPGIHWI